MESSPCPVSLSIKPSDGRDPREWILKLKEQKPIYPPGIASIWLCVCLNGKWKVILITLLSLCLLEGLSANLAGRLALCPCADVLLAHAWPSLLVTLKPFWLLFLFGKPKRRSTKWETTSELGAHKRFPGQLLPQRRKRRLWGSPPNFWK